MREKQANHMYFKELLGAFVIYFIVIFLSNFLADQMTPQPLRTLIILAPVIPAIMMIWAIIRQFRRMDEYIRRRQLENVGISAAMTAVFALSYGFMEAAGFPKLSMFIVWGLLMAGWGVSDAVRCWKEKSA